MAFGGSKRGGFSRRTWREQSGILGVKNADINAENSYFWNINPDIST
jgi:hypothetical protein